jgi:hypothetical protein
MDEECIICFDETEHFVFLPCAHKLCPRCKELLEQKKCPVCNTPFEEPFEEPIQHVTRIEIRRNTVVIDSTLKNSSTKCIIFILLSFFVYVAYHVSDTDTDT